MRLKAKIFFILFSVFSFFFLLFFPRVDGFAEKPSYLSKIIASFLQSRRWALIDFSKTDFELNCVPKRIKFISRSLDVSLSCVILFGFYLASSFIRLIICWDSENMSPLLFYRSVTWFRFWIIWNKCDFKTRFCRNF